MDEIIKRQNRIAIAVVIAVVALIAILGIAYLLGFPPFSPTPEQARAALAESGWCEPDAPIVKREGRLLIGEYECDLANSRFNYWPKLSRGHFERQHGRWIACPRYDERMNIR